MSYFTRNKTLTDNNSERGYGIKCANKNHLSPYFQSLYQQNYLQEAKKRRCVVDRQRAIAIQRTPNSLANKQTLSRVGSKEILKKIGFEFSINYKLGKGRYSKVLQGVYKPAQKKFAIKVIDLENITVDFRDKFLPREIECWKKLNHPNICYLYLEFVKFNYQFAIMELAEYGDLLAYVQKNGRVPEPTALKWMVQLINAVKYLHSIQIAHRDLKMENVLLFNGENGMIVKISDFGFCKQSNDLSLTHCGSKSYSAPEILQGSIYDIFKSDVWSLGVVGFVMLTNTMPFVENVEHNWMIVEAQREKRYCYPNEFNLSIICRMSIDAMMTFDADKRPSINQCCQLFWFRSEYKKSTFQFFSNRRFQPFENFQIDSFICSNDENNNCQMSENNVDLNLLCVNSQKNQKFINQQNTPSKKGKESFLKSIPTVITPNVLKKKFLR